MAQILLDTDSFGGTNGTALPSYNANWNTVGTLDSADVLIAGTPGIGSVADNASANYRTGATWTNDQWGELTVDSTNLVDVDFGRWAILLHATGGTATNCYACGIFPSLVDATLKYRIGRYDGMGGFNLLVDEPGGTLMQTGDVVNAQVVGTVITLKVTRSGVDAFTPFTYDYSGDTTKYTTGNPGVHLESHTAVRLAGSWRAGSVGSSATVAQTMPAMDMALVHSAMIGRRFI
jgi:hypothetical protein